jgi:hypothetical protein
VTRLTLSLASALALIGCASIEPAGTAAPAVDTGAYFSANVTGADALFPVAARSAALRRIDFGTGRPHGEKVCVRERDMRPIAPLVAPSLAAMKAGPVEYTTAPRDYARAVNDAAFRVLLTQDDALAAEAVATIRRHADADAWLPADRESWTASGVVVEGMGPLLPAWQILRQARGTSAADRAAIDAWIARLAVMSDVRESENNGASYHGANDMLLGLMTGEGGRYAAGRRAIVAQLAAMRPDGSFPLEVERGRGALDNQSRNVGFLVYAADIAESNGDDLWNAEVDGKSIRTAIRFFLDAAADNTLVDRYAAANVRPPRDAPDFRPNDQLDPFRNTTRAWAISFTERFPRDPLSAELRASMELGNRVQSDVTGGNSSCYASRL